MARPKIKKVEIVIGEKRLELSIDELRELKDLLNELFSDNKPVYVPISVPEPRPLPWKWWEPIWVGTGSSTGTLSIYNKSET